MMSKDKKLNALDNVVISSGKNFERFVSVKFLNDETVYFGVEKNCKVNELFSKICVHLGLADCAELFGIAIKQINYPTSLFGSLTNHSNYYSASQVEDSIKQEDTQFEEEYIFLHSNSKLSKFTSRQWKSSKNGLDSMGKAYLQCFFRVQFYVDSYLFISDRVARHHYYLQIRQNVINYNLNNLTPERAFLLTSLALQAEKGNYVDRKQNHFEQSSSILNSTFLNTNNHDEIHNHSYSQLHHKNSSYFDPYDYMPKWIVYQIGENYILENMPTMHKEQHGISRMDAEMMFIKEASEICSHNLHMYRLFKTNPSSLNKKLTNVNSHLNGFFHGHHLNSSMHSNSSYSSTMTNQSSATNSHFNNSSSTTLNTGNTSSSSNNNKDGKVWLAISATGVQLFEQDKQVFVNKSNDALGFLDLDISDNRFREQSSSVFYLRSKLSTFIWHDIEKLFFDRKKFEIRSNGYPIRKFTYYTHSDEMAKNLLWLCKMSHRFQLFIQPQLNEMKKRENELSRRKYRESYIYSDVDRNSTKSQKDQQSIHQNEQNVSKLADTLMEYQQEPSSCIKHLVSNKPRLSTPESIKAPLSLDKSIGNDSLNSSHGFPMKKLFEEMKPMMDKMDEEISKLQFDQTRQNVMDLSTTNITSNSSSKINSNESDVVQTLEKSSSNTSDLSNMLSDSQKFDQSTTNPFLDQTTCSQLNYATIFHQSSQQQLQLNNLDDFVIEHKADDHNQANSALSVQSPSSNSLKIELNEACDNSSQSIKLKPNAQTFSLESLTCSGLSEPSSSSGISEQEFSSSSADQNGGKNSSLLMCTPPSCENPHIAHLNHLNDESPNSLNSRCSSNTSYSSDSALGKYISNNKHSKQTVSKLPMLTQKIVTNYVKHKPSVEIRRHKKQHACSVNDLHDKGDYFSTINNNHLLEDFNHDTNGDVHKGRHSTESEHHVRTRTHKSKFEMKNKNKLNALQYKSLPNVNNFDDGQTRFGRLDVESTDNSFSLERSNFSNRSDKSTSSEQSTSTIKSKINKPHISTDQAQTHDSSSRSFDNYKLNSSQSHLWTPCALMNENSLDASLKNRVHIYENLPFQRKSVNQLLMNNSLTTSTTNSFLPVTNLITTTPNRIATKIGVSSLNRCNKLSSDNNSNQKGKTTSNNLRTNLFNTGLDRPTLKTTCSYQLLNDNEHFSTMNQKNRTTPFKTTRTSSDPGVLTYSSTSNLMKIPCQESSVFYSISPNQHSITRNQHEATSQMTFNYDLSPAFHHSLSNIATNSETESTNSLFKNESPYDTSLMNQINNARQASIKKKQHHFHPLRLAESEMNLVSRNTNQIALAPPPQFDDSDEVDYKMKATSEQQLNLFEETCLKQNEINEQMTIKNLRKFKSPGSPLVSTLFNDKSLIMLPKTVPNHSRQQHQKQNRYSLHLQQNVDPQTVFSPTLVNKAACTDRTNTETYQQTNLDDVSSLLDDSLIINTSRDLGYDNNYNDLKSNNLNKLENQLTKLQMSSSMQISKADCIDKIWADHLLN